MNFIIILVPAVMAALGLYIILNSAGRKSRDFFSGKVMRSAGAVLAAAGCYFEFVVSAMSASELFLRAVVVFCAVGAVIASEVAKGMEASCTKSSFGDVCAAVYSAKATRTACAVMTLVLASVVTTI